MPACLPNESKASSAVLGVFLLSRLEASWEDLRVRPSLCTIMYRVFT